jgi:hypothetical protein
MVHSKYVVQRQSPREVDSVKKIPLRTIKENVDGKEFALDYAEVMISSLRAGGAQGITVEEMRRRIKALDRVEEAKKEERDHVLLEEAEHTVVLEMVKQFRFGGLFRGAIQMIDELEHAADIQVAEVKDADSEA